MATYGPIAPTHHLEEYPVRAAGDQHHILSFCPHGRREDQLEHSLLIRLPPLIEGTTVVYPLREGWRSRYPLCSLCVSLSTCRLQNLHTPM